MFNCAGIGLVASAQETQPSDVHRLEGIADLVVIVASDEAGFMSGSEVVIDAARFG